MKTYIIVPVYNTAEYLKKCLDSVFAQTSKDYVLICVNDGSTDSSLDILQSYEKEHKNMIVISKENGGLSSARNAALNVITDWEHSYITYLDSDDYISEDYVESLSKQIEKSGADILCSSFFHVRGEEIWKTKAVYEEGAFNVYDSLCFLLSGKVQSHCQCKMYKGTLWKDTRFDESICFMEDQAMTFQMFLKCKSIAFTNWAGYYLLIRDGSLCRSVMTNKKILSALKSYRISCEYDFSIFEKDQNEFLKENTLSLFSRTYLMMYPRFNKKNATEKEISEWNDILKYVKKEKIIRKYKPSNKKFWLKRFVYLYFRFMYTFLYKFFFKEYDR